METREGKGGRAGKSESRRGSKDQQKQIEMAACAEGEQEKDVNKQKVQLTYLVIVALFDPF